MKLSVVIPVYNVEGTLERCVESILRQDVPEMEIILVDDGSPDRCPEICDDMSAKHPLIRTIHKENGGLSSARNAGISAATGDYITFADSDDFVKEGTYRELMGILETNSSYDIIEYPVIEFFGSNREHKLSFNDAEYTCISDYWLKGKAYAHAYAWNKIYRMSLFKDVRFPEGKVFEDAWTLPQLLSNASCIATCSRGLYFYCMNDRGITNNAGGREFKMLLDAHVTAMKCMQLPEGFDFLCYYMHVANTQIQAYEYCGRKVSVPDITIGKELWAYLADRNIKMSFKIKCIIIKIFNLNVLCRLTNLLIKKHRIR